MKAAERLQHKPGASSSHLATIRESFDNGINSNENTKR
jgi:hypothetical protein